MIEVNERVEVSSTPEEVWKVLSDPQSVAECVEGATLGERAEDGSYDARLRVSFGPARVTFKARFTLALDPANLSGTVSSRGKDDQGGTRIKADMGFRIVPRDGTPGSVVLIDAKTEVGGRLATIVETGANIVVGRMTADFARKLEERLNSNRASQDAAPAAPIEAVPPVDMPSPEPAPVPSVATTATPDAAPTGEAPTAAEPATQQNPQEQVSPTN